VSTPGVKARVLLLCLVLALVGVAGAIAGGQKESRLDEAKALIAQKDYAAALNLLKQIFTDDPELRDQVQPLIDQIFAKREQFNKVLTELVAAREAEDDQKMQELDAQLREIDPKAAAAEVGRSIDVRIAFLALMNKAAEALAAGRPREALADYLLPLKDPVSAGLDLQKPEFDKAGYGTLVAGSVADSAARILARADRALGSADAAAAVPAEVRKLLAQQLTASSPSAFEAAVSPLQGDAAAEGAVRAAAASLAELNASVAVGRGKPEPYLEYLVWLARGREGRVEGIAVALAGLWEAPARAVLDAAAARSTSAYSAAIARYQASDLAGADAAFVDAYNAGVLAVKAGALVVGSLQTSAAAGWALAPDQRAEAATLVSDALAAQAHAAEARALQGLLTERSELKAMAQPGRLTPDQLGEARKDLFTRIAAADAGSAEWKSRATALAGQVTAGVAPADLPDSATRVADEYSSLGQNLKRMDASYATDQATREETALGAALTDAVKARKKAQDLANGTVDGVPTAGAPRKPSEAITQYESTSASLTTLAGQVASLHDRLQTETSWTLESPGFQAIVRSVDALQSSVAAESKEIDRLTGDAQKQRENALASRKQADTIFASAVRAFNQKSYDVARESFRSSRDLYIDSLVFEDDATALARSTTEVDSYLQRIDDATWAESLAAVDSKINEGQTQFDNGDFLKSFSTLQDALRDWRAIQPDQPYPRLDSLIEKVRAALQTSGGRDLDPSDSRADTVNGFLVNARNQLTKANALARGSALRVQYLNDALANVQYALEIVPVYRKAKALELTIRQAQSPNDAQFKVLAGNEVQRIMDDYGANRITAEEAYFQLKDYQPIIPDYRGLKALLDKLEIALGFRSTPVSSADLAESDQQYRDAVDLYNVGTAESLQLAMNSVNKALQLNPKNTAAATLRRSILLKTGSSEVRALSPDDAQRFTEARRYIANNDYASAYPILQDLMTKNGGRNKSYTQLADTYQAVRQALGLT
jgi:hypothetical protein